MLPQRLPVGSLFFRYSGYARCGWWAQWSDIIKVQCQNCRKREEERQWNGEIIALAMDTNMKKELCIKTITEAYKNFDIKDGAIIHSDGGSQYTSSEYKKILGQLHAVQSMSGVGKCSLKCNSWRNFSFWKLLHSRARQAHLLIRDVCAKQTRRVFKRYHLYRLK